MVGKDSKEYWCALANISRLGARTFARLRSLGCENKLPLSDKELLDIGVSVPAVVSQGFATFTPEKGVPIVAHCEREGIEIITWGSPAYPPALARSRYALPVLFAKGDTSIGLAQQSLAMVGTRTPGPWADFLCSQLIASLESTNTLIVSGLAQGIDSLCHHHALNLNLPTCAVIAQGLDLSLGGSREKIAQRILKSKGLIISPFPPGKVAHPSQFIQRNQIIAGMSQWTLLVESRENGGAMHTAHFAIEDHRELLTIPGDPWRESAQGGNTLIKSGLAKPVWHPQDLPNLLQINASSNRNGTNKNNLPTEWAHLAGKRISRTELFATSNKSMSELLAILTQLEIRGQCQVHDGEWIVFF